MAVGGEREHGWPKATTSCRVPVGDYKPDIMVEYGRLRFMISRSQPRKLGSEFYGIKIRKHKPYVLDFSNRPEVMFAAPSKDTRVKVGGTLRVQGVSHRARTGRHDERCG